MNKHSKTGEVHHCSVCGSPFHNKLFHKPKPQTKICRVCGKELPVSEFRITRRKRLHGYSTYPTTTCISCCRKRSHERYRSSFRHRFEYLLASIKHRCHKNHIPCTITIDFLEELFNKQKGLCYYTGTPLSLVTGHNAISIDRLDPSKGYIPENVVLSKWLINNMKCNLTKEEFLDICRTIFHRFNK